MIGRRSGEGIRLDGLIAAAIEQRRLPRLAYSTGNRIVEPHVYGLASDSKELLRCYQLAGESASRHRAGWKAMLRATPQSPFWYSW